MSDVDVSTMPVAAPAKRRAPSTSSRAIIPGRPRHQAHADLEQVPAVSVSETEGLFTIRADFSNVADAERVTVQFSEQGVIITGGPVQRYVPIPTDGDIERAIVSINDRIARVSVPTAGLGHRWRAIVMW